MKKIKDLGLILAVLFMGLTLVACGDTSADGENNDSAEYNENQESGSGEFAMQRGEWDGDTFTNTYSGISFELPAGFTVFSDDMLGATMDLGMEMQDLSDTEREIAELALDSFMVIDTVASNLMETITITYSTDIVLLGVSDLESYLLSQVEIREESFDVEATYELSTQTIGGEAFNALLLEYDWMGGVYREMMLIRQEGSHLINISIVSENPEELLAIFN